jgi:hypothetical protein
MQRLVTLVFLVVMALGAPLAALAQMPDLPGLANDSERYRSELQRRFPAGGTPGARVAAENRAVAAERANKWAEAAAAWEERVGMGEPQAPQYLALARAQLARTPPEAARALQAAWLKLPL